MQETTVGFGIPRNWETSIVAHQPDGVYEIKQTAVIKMLYLIGPDGLVDRGFVNFQKIVTCCTIKNKYLGYK